jgi:hypothetical protein
MKRFEKGSRSPMRFVALLMVASVAGCGDSFFGSSGGGSGGPGRAGAAPALGAAAAFGGFGGNAG